MRGEQGGRWARLRQVLADAPAWWVLVALAVAYAIVLGVESAIFH